MKTLEQLTAALADRSTEISKKISTINIKAGKCSAHLYHLERQGDSPKSRFIYRCLRAGCRHYATFTNIEGRSAQCRKCGDIFGVSTEMHLIKSKKGMRIEELRFEYPCCCISEEIVAPVNIREASALEFLEE